ncbi:MAG: sigma-70 family RNA polymerase sigma factor [Pseudomonadota bacterium]
MLNRNVTQSSDISDGDLLAAVAAGDARAFQRLHDRYHRRIFGFAMRLVDRPDRAEEIANDALLAIWRNARQFEGRSRPATWIFGIVYRIAMKTRRRWCFERRHDELEEAAEIVDTTAPTVEAMIVRHQVEEALKALGTEARAIMQLTYFYGFTCEEVANVVNCPVGTVKSRMAKARAAMKQTLTSTDKNVRRSRRGS